MLSQLSHCIHSHKSAEGKGSALVSSAWRQGDFLYISCSFQLSVGKRALFRALVGGQERGLPQGPA